MSSLIVNKLELMADSQLSLPSNSLHFRFNQEPARSSAFNQPKACSTALHCAATLALFAPHAFSHFAAHKEAIKYANFHINRFRRELSAASAAIPQSGDSFLMFHLD